MPDKPPKVFISYSWTSQSHQELVIGWAERLIADGVDVVLDVYDLKEGQDKYVFMERMVTDPSVSHVLVVSDKSYAQKADARKAGVGTESQIISQEVYEKTEQSKFIPLVCEFLDENTPFLPTFLKTRIWIDFSSPEAVNGSWEKLIRVLYGKPLYEKPVIGKAPAYLAESFTEPSSPARSKYETFRQALLQQKKGIAAYRRQFIEATIDFVDALRIRTQPEPEGFAAQIMMDCGKLVQARDVLVDWVILESEAAPSEDFIEALISLLEALHEIRSRPAEVNRWNESWFDAHRLFVYELFLYIVAGLLKTRSYKYLHTIFTTQYLLPASVGQGSDRFVRFDNFYAHSEILNSELAPKGQKLFSPAAELLKRQAQRKDLPFVEIIQADLLVLLMAFIDEGVRWYPQLMHYSTFAREFPFFIRASQHKYYLALATITGIADVEKLRAAVKDGHTRLNVAGWYNFIFERNFANAMNLDKLDTMK